MTDICTKCGFHTFSHKYHNGSCMPLSERMPKADWWHDYSDDTEVRQRGAGEIHAIYNALRILCETDPNSAWQLSKEHAPKEWWAPGWLLKHQEPKSC